MNVRKLVWIILSILPFAVSAENEWVRLLASDKNIILKDIVSDEIGNTYIAGEHLDGVRVEAAKIYHEDGKDAFIVKFNSEGRLQWSKAITNNGNQMVTALAVNSEDHVYAALEFIGTIKIDDLIIKESSGMNSLLVKLNKDGSLEWAKQIKGISNEKIEDIATDQDGNIFVAGHFSNEIILGNGDTLRSPNDYDLFIAKFDKEGDLKWAEKFQANSASHFKNIAVDHLGNIYVAGNFTEAIVFQDSVLRSRDNFDAFIAKFNDEGKVEWTDVILGENADLVTAIAVDKLNNLIIAGSFQQDIVFDDSEEGEASPHVMLADDIYNIYFVKYSAKGQLLWYKEIDEELGSEEAKDITTDIYGNIYLVGQYDHPVFETGRHDIPRLEASDNFNYFVAKFNNEGIQESAFRVSGSTSESRCYIDVDANNNTFIAAEFDGQELLGDYSIESRNGTTNVFLWKKQLLDIGSD